MSHICRVNVAIVSKDFSVSKCPDRSAFSRYHSLFWIKRLHCQLLMCYQLLTRHFPWFEKVASKNNTVRFVATFKRNTTNDMSQIKSRKAYRGARSFVWGRFLSAASLMCLCNKDSAGKTKATEKPHETFDRNVSESGVTSELTASQ